MTTVYYLYDYEQAVSYIFELLLSKGKNKDTFEVLSGEVIDPKKIFQTRKIDVRHTPNGDIDQIDFNIGEYKFTVNIIDSLSISKAPFVRMLIEYQGLWAGSVNYYDIGNTDLYWIIRVERAFFETIKKRASITIREHSKYLANPTKYDTLQQVFGIKVRKKK